MTARRRLASWWFAGAAVLAAAGAQEQRLVHSEQDRPVVTLTANVCAGSARPNGVGFVRLEVENLEPRPREALVVLATTRGSAADVRVTRSFALGPQERAVAFLPVPRPLGFAQLTFRVDGKEQVAAFAIAKGDGLVGLVLAERPDAAPATQLRLQAATSPWPGTAEVVAIAAGDAPTDWRLYSGFHVVVLDTRSRVPTDVQEALRRAAFAGLCVVVAGDGLSAGPLRQLAAATRGVAPLGFGRLAVIPSLEGDAASARTIMAGLGTLGEGPLPVADTLLFAQPIPGLGQAPVAAFLLVIVLFAAIAGPVNFLLLRRWRRPLLALVTVPVLGFGTTFVILLYGFVHDGFGVRGVVTSWTCLDQAQHEAAAVVSRTLFAGRAPGAVTMGPDTLLLAPRATQRESRAADRWHFDSTAGRLDGGVLPSRTPTPWVAVQQGVARQRLVARKAGDGWQLTGDGGIEATGEVVLRGLDGAFYGGQAPDLRPLSRPAALQLLERLAARGGSLEVEVPQERQWRHRGGPLPVDLETRPLGMLAERVFSAASLPPGGYVAQVRTAPWLDAHGLAIADDLQRHFVRGRMHGEDFLP